MPEGDTIHRLAARIEAALGGRTIERISAPNPRSPLHGRVGGLGDATLERAEARGKHLLLHLSGERVIHSHLGMSGRWFVRESGESPPGRPWLLLESSGAAAAQSGGRLLRLLSARRARSDPTLLALGPDPLASGFDLGTGAQRLLAWGPTEQVGAALLDEGLLAGVGNVIRIEACFAAAVSPWRRVGQLGEAEAEAIVAAVCGVMGETVRSGRRPKRIYGRERFPCPRCGGRIERRRQGDDGRLTVWCPGCQL